MRYPSNENHGAQNLVELVRRLRETDEAHTTRINELGSPATDSSLGLVKVGIGLTVDSGGQISADVGAISNSEIFSIVNNETV